MTEPSTKPILFLVSAPSGAGKTTLCHRLLEEEPLLRYSVSVTTRPPREGEVNGVDYEFTDRASFLRRVEDGDFLEYAEVHGNFYGTSRSKVEALLGEGYSVLMDVDVQGARQIREVLSRDEETDFFDVFISPPSMESLRIRLEGRGKDDASIIERRLKNAAREMEDAPRYAFQVVNDDLDIAFETLRSIYRSCGEKKISQA